MKDFEIKVNNCIKRYNKALRNNKRAMQELVNALREIEDVLDEAEKLGHKVNFDRGVVNGLSKVCEELKDIPYMK